ncbi:glycoside hydrolase superfamily [Ampelomyces quisqualis]|uniref:Probable beta-glucosidase btgE n=1 Tax=Ampelomyces quisqualis TaxID=50730 RepID=A0A6A5QAU6_AMPQU|nr:glycoside hydrolase superfamily [Ampelomyces quisqualis]
MKGSIIAASAALAGSVAAFEHPAHAALHLHRGDYKSEDVCTVYTTVYVTALPSIVANSTWVGPSLAPTTSTPCSEEEKTTTPVPAYSPITFSSIQVKPSPAPPAPQSPAPPANPETSQPAEVLPPAPSKPAENFPPAPPMPGTPDPAAPPAYSQPPDTPKPTPSSSIATEKPKPTGGYSSGGHIITNGDKWAMTYTPYAKDGQCKTSQDIASDIKKISELGFTTIRSYSTDCGVFEFVVPECQKHGLKVIYGIFLEGGGSAGKGPFSNYANTQLEDIKNKAPKDSVAMVIVGNECMFNNNCQASELASYIDHVRNELQSAGFPKDTPITTTEPVGTWEEKGAALCDHIDIFAAQVHPYFTNSISAEMAGDFAVQQLAQAAKVCPQAAERGTYITEIGWPKSGNNNGLAVASSENQKIAIQKILEKVGSQACLFSFQNDEWKHPGALGVEQSFGCVDALA